MEQRSLPAGKCVSPQAGQVNGRATSEYEYNEEWPTRMPNSVRRYHSDVKHETGRAPADAQTFAQRDTISRRGKFPPQRGTPQAQSPAGRMRQRSGDTEDITTRRSNNARNGYTRLRVHWLVHVGLAMVIMAVGWIILSSVADWWQMTQDDWHYGRPRTYQTDYVVGHDDADANPSHFIALNLHRRIEVMECPGGDCAKAKIYIGPLLVGSNQDLAPVTLDFKDVTADHKLDMIVNVQNSRFVFINENGTFRPQRPGESIQL
ncbi:MAG: hypothetical protein E6J34_13795 [Chloroflexi bacterium]|nr:MAG: hypothetical protein E6J34_13795 [Chloroflexota bacterium]